MNSKELRTWAQREVAKHKMKRAEVDDIMSQMADAMIDNDGLDDFYARLTEEDRRWLRETNIDYTEE